jgi:metal-responsive CopG/Arc/MetJ family transcriptional regulator
MKLSLSIPEEDVEFLDSYAKSHGAGSRSAAVQQAIRTLRATELASDYEAAFAEWIEDQNDQAWDSTASDGLTA